MSTTEMLKYWNKSNKFGIPTYVCTTQNHPEIEVRTDKFPYCYQFNVGSNVYSFVTLNEALLNANQWVRNNWKWIFIGKHFTSKI